MGGQSKWDYLRAIWGRYQKADVVTKGRILDEFCAVCGYNRKYAIRKLNAPKPEKPKRPVRRRRGVSYSQQAVGVIVQVWAAAGYPCSVRLKAILGSWMPVIRRRYRVTPEVERQLLAISARQIDRRLAPARGRVRGRLYGRTKPGTLLKHQIPVKTDHWDVQGPGFTEVDLVAHGGNSAEGEFAYSVNQTDIQTGWVETRAVLGKGQTRVCQALAQMRQAFPFAVLAIDSDNGSEFINYHLHRYCEQEKIWFTRGRPYKKDDHAHVEQKNWTHVRKLIGWGRYDTPEAVKIINDLYTTEWRQLQNLFMPSVNLVRKTRVGSKIRRVYDKPQTPLERVIASAQGDPEKLADLLRWREQLDPFALAAAIDTKLHRVWRLAHPRLSPAPAQAPAKSHRPASHPPTPAPGTSSRRVA